MSGAIPLFLLYVWYGQEQLLPLMISGTYTEETNPTFTYKSTLPWGRLVQAWCKLVQH